MLQAYKDMMDVLYAIRCSAKRQFSKFVDVDVLCFKRILNNEEVLVLINVRNSSVDFDIPADLQIQAGLMQSRMMIVSLTETLAMSPYKFLILKN